MAGTKRFGFALYLRPRHWEWSIRKSPFTFAFDLGPIAFWIKRKRK